MDQAFSSQFVHRENRDGTFDSICHECYATVGTAQWEAELDKVENAHACDPEELEHIAELKREADLRNTRAPVQSETGQTRSERRGLHRASR